MTASAHAIDLAARADVALAAALRDLAAGDAASALERAVAAMLLLASACLAAEPNEPDHRGRRAAIVSAFGAAFGRGGRLYTAYFRWLLDADNLSRAAAMGLPGAGEIAAAETMVERAELFRDGAGRYLARA